MRERIVAPAHDADVSSVLAPAVSPGRHRCGVARREGTQRVRVRGVRDGGRYGRSQLRLVLRRHRAGLGAGQGALLHAGVVGDAPERQALILVAGDKSGSWNTWYDRNIPVADDRFDEHLDTLNG
jgi:hypothetical protein